MDDPAFAPEETGGVDINTQTILLHASNHDVAALKPLLRIPGNASVQDPETGFTPLHAVIAACGPAKPPKSTPFSSTPNPISNETHELKSGEEEEEEVDIEKGKKTVEELFFSGAIWNDLDKNGETPGCLAYRLGRMELYEMCVNAGVRAEMLLGLMGGYEELAGEDSEDDDVEAEAEDMEKENGNGANGHTHELAVGPAEEAKLEAEGKRDVNSEDYLKSELTFTDTALLDEDANGVMMAWETDIMRRSVDLLLPGLEPGKKILNVGFGMGIIDAMFAATKPSTHHIIEAHPSVLQHIRNNPSHKFGKSWEESEPEGRYKIHAGKWQDICPKLLEAGEVYDAIYFDTFGEDYSQLKLFFSEFIPGLLDSAGKFGFFNGLGADRRVCYDVYGKVVELDLCESGMDVEWTDVEVGELGKEGEGEWKGVRRRYWTLVVYRLPVATFMG